MKLIQVPEPLSLVGLFVFSTLLPFKAFTQPISAPTPVSPPSHLRPEPGLFRENVRLNLSLTASQNRWFAPNSLSLRVRNGELIGPISLNFSGGCRFIEVPRNGSAGWQPGLPGGSVNTYWLDGFFVPKPFSLVPNMSLPSNRCTANVHVPLRRPTGAIYADRASFPVTLNQLESLEITDTARLRPWLKPYHNLLPISIGCSDDDRDGKLGIRITTGPGGANCQTEFLTTANRRGLDFDGIPDQFPDYNVLPREVFLTAMRWRVEGDLSTCQVCVVADRPCKESPLLTPVLQSQRIRTDPHGYTIKTGTMPINGIYSDPSKLREGNRVLDAIGVTIGYNDEKVFRQYLEQWQSGMSCAAWAPPPGDVIAGAATTLQNLAAGNATPAPQPQPPTLRLVLDSVTFVKPVGLSLRF